MKSSENWQINHTFARRSLLVFSFAMVILLIPSIKYVEQLNYFIITPLSLGILFIFFIALKICYYSFLSKKITIESGTIFIPRLFLKDYRIDFREVAALESCSVKSSHRTILIIRRKKIPVAVSEDLFMCNEHFEEFVSQIKRNIVSEYESEKEISSIKSLTTHILPASIATTLIISFFVFLQDFSSVSNAAVEIGGLTKDSFIPSEVYRLFSSFFLHYNLPHLALNLIALGIFSRPVETKFGRLRVVNIIFISALTASIFSVLLSPFDIIIGASGGLFGLVGAYTIIYFKYTDQLVGSVFIQKNVLVLTIALQVICDSFVDDVDYYSHFFGFIAGVICAGYVCYFQTTDQIAKYPLVEKVCASTLCTANLLALTYIFIQYNN